MPTRCWSGSPLRPLRPLGGVIKLGHDFHFDEGYVRMGDVCGLSRAY